MLAEALSLFDSFLSSCAKDFKMVWGAIAAVVAAQIIGGLLYSPYVLGTRWMQATFPGRTKESIADHAAPAYAVTLVSSGAVALMLNFILINSFQVKAVLDAVKFAGGLAVLSALVDISHLAFSQRNLIAFIIDHTFNFLMLVAMAACIFYFN